jgi:hypothetical protein
MSRRRIRECHFWQPDEVNPLRLRSWNRDDTLKYLLNELTFYENDHRDATFPSMVTMFSPQRYLQWRCRNWFSQSTASSSLRTRR